MWTEKSTAPFVSPVAPLYIRLRANSQRKTKQWNICPNVCSFLPTLECRKVHGLPHDYRGSRLSAEKGHRGYRVKRLSRVALAPRCSGKETRVHSGITTNAETTLLSCSYLSDWLFINYIPRLINRIRQRCRVICIMYECDLFAKKCSRLKRQLCGVGTRSVSSGKFSPREGGI